MPEFDGSACQPQATGKRERAGKRRIKHEFICGCGSIFWTDMDKIKSGHTKSCGCLQKKRASEANFRHGLTDSQEYKAWVNMLTRCYNINYSGWKRYGGRGIEVCEQWQNDFSQFLKDVGKKPADGYCLDRVNNNGNYEPSNVRWADKFLSSRNRAVVKKITIYGYTFTIPEWSIISGISRKNIWRRVNAGWGSVNSIFQPTNRYSSKDKSAKKMTKSDVLRKIKEFNKAKALIQ